MASDITPRGTFSMVTDVGRSHPLADAELLEGLGYGGVEPVRMPAWLVARIPQGNGLDPDAALRPVLTARTALLGGCGARTVLIGKTNQGSSGSRPASEVSIVVA